jgi:hypothetical protein
MGGGGGREARGRISALQTTSGGGVCPINPVGRMLTALRWADVFYWPPGLDFSSKTGLFAQAARWRGLARSLCFLVQWGRRTDEIPPVSGHVGRLAQALANG